MRLTSRPRSMNRVKTIVEDCGICSMESAPGTFYPISFATGDEARFYRVSLTQEEAEELRGWMNKNLKPGGGS